MRRCSPDEQEHDLDREPEDHLLRLRVRLALRRGGLRVPVPRERVVVRVAQEELGREDGVEDERDCGGGIGSAVAGGRDDGEQWRRTHLE